MTGAYPAIENSIFLDQKMHFSKGVNLWFWRKIRNFFNPYFSSKLFGKNVLTIFLKEKNICLTTRNSIDLFRTKKCILPKGLIHDFGQKFQISFNRYFSSTWVNHFRKMHFLLLKRLNFSWLINSSCLSRKYSNSITTTSSLKY